MISRAVKTCESCPYKPIDLKLPRLRTINGQKVNICDIDLVLEVGGEIKAIAELKRYKNADIYPEFWIPAHEFVLMKRVALALNVDLFLIIENGKEFYLTEIDPNERKPGVLNFYSRKHIIFDKSEFARFQNWELERFLRERYGDDHAPLSKERKKEVILK